LLDRPQQAFASLQQSAPSTQHFWMPPQHPLFSVQHFRPLSQQSSLASATQQADWSAQQASFLVQQLSALSTTLDSCLAVSFVEQQAATFVTAVFVGLLQADWSAQQVSFLVQQLPAVSATLDSCLAVSFVEQQAVTFVAAAFVELQQAFASLQHAKPSAQHFWTEAQYPLFSVQHFSPLSQQPSLASATQQALLGLQQASLSEQQSFACSSAKTAPMNRMFRSSNEPAISLLDMKDSPVNVVW
jgi:hypothetical protein